MAEQDWTKKDAKLKKRWAKAPAWLKDAPFHVRRRYGLYHDDEWQKLKDRSRGGWAGLKDFGKGALTGAVSGFATGGPVGAVVGGVGGGIAGAKASERESDRLEAERRAARGEGVASGPGGQPLVHPGLDAAINARANLANQLGNRSFSPFRAQQQQYIDSLRADAEGRGLAQEMVRRQVSQQAQSGIQNQLAQSASARGGYNPLAARTAAVNSALISGNAGQAASLGGIQAQLGARGQLQGALAGARGQDQSFMDLTQRGQLDALSQQNQLFNLYGQGAQHGATLASQIELEKLRQKFEGRNDPSTFDEILATGVGALEMYNRTRGSGGSSSPVSTGGATRPKVNFGDSGVLKRPVNPYYSPNSNTNYKL